MFFEYLREPTVNRFACMRLNTLADAEKEMRNGIYALRKITIFLASIFVKS